MTPDRITVSVIQHRLESIVEEMGEAMLRTAYSQILNSSRDFSTAVFDAEGRLAAQAEHVPIHVGALPWAVASIADFFKGRIRPGDMLLLNDPYHGNNHLPDLTVLLRVFVGERLTFPAVVIPSKKEQRLTRCGPAEGVSMTCSHGRPKSKFLSASLTGARRLMTGARNGPHLHHSGRFHIAQVPGVP